MQSIPSEKINRVMIGSIKPFEWGDYKDSIVKGEDLPREFYQVLLLKQFIKATYFSKFIKKSFSEVRIKNYFP